MNTTTNTLTARQARSIAKAISTQGNHQIEIVEEFPSGERYVSYFNRCYNRRTIRSLDDFARLQATEG